MAGKESHIESGEGRRRGRVRSLFVQLSAWENLLLGILALAILAVCIQPLPMWLTQRRAARYRAEIAGLAGSQNIDDWTRLVELTQIRVAPQFPRPLAWLFLSGENKRAGHGVAVHGLATEAMREILAGDHWLAVRTLNSGTVFLRALTSGTAELSAWIWREIGPKHRFHITDYADILAKRWAATHDASIRDWLVSGNRTGIVAEMPLPPTFDPVLRSATLWTIARDNREDTLPIAREYLKVNTGNALSEHIDWVRAWCEGGTTTLPAFRYDGYSQYYLPAK